jgi:transposase
MPHLKMPAEKILQDIRRATRKHYSAGDKIRIVLDGLRGDESIAELCRSEGWGGSVNDPVDRLPYECPIDVLHLV